MRPWTHRDQTAVLSARRSRALKREEQRARIEQRRAERKKRDELSPAERINWRLDELRHDRRELAQLSPTDPRFQVQMREIRNEEFLLNLKLEKLNAGAG